MEGCVADDAGDVELRKRNETHVIRASALEKIVSRDGRMPFIDQRRDGPIARDRLRRAIRAHGDWQNFHFDESSAKGLASIRIRHEKEDCRIIRHRSLR